MVVGQVKTIFVPTGATFTSEVCAPLGATIPLEVNIYVEKVVFLP